MIWFIVCVCFSKPEVGSLPGTSGKSAGSGKTTWFVSFYRISYNALQLLAHV